MSGAKSKILKFAGIRKAGEGDLAGRIPARAVLDAAQDQDALVCAIVDEAAASLGVGIANLANLLDPDCIILGGEVHRADERYVSRIKQVARDRSLSEIAVRQNIMVSDLGEDGGIMGATALVWNKVLSLVA